MTLTISSAVCNGSLESIFTCRSRILRKIENRLEMASLIYVHLLCWNKIHFLIGLPSYRMPLDTSNTFLSGPKEHVITHISQSFSLQPAANYAALSQWQVLLNLFPSPLHHFLGQDGTELHAVPCGDAQQPHSELRPGCLSSTGLCISPDKRKTVALLVYLDKMLPLRTRRNFLEKSEACAPKER